MVIFFINELRAFSKGNVGENIGYVGIFLVNNNNCHTSLDISFEIKNRSVVRFDYDYNVTTSGVYLDL